MAINVIHGQTLSDALENKYRLYLCGDKSMVQPELEYVPDDNIEIGISQYTEFTADKL